jgi:hypothetical protein
MSSLNTLKEQIAAVRTKARSLKTKAAQQKQYTKARELEHQALMLLFAARDSYAVHSVKGTVRWSHAGQDNFAVSTPYGTLHPSPTSDVLSKSWYGQTCCVEYTEGQQVILEIKVDVDMERLCLEVIPSRVIGGTLNATQYAELDKRTDLAFFKHSNSTGVTGLFASKAGA